MSIKSYILFSTILILTGFTGCSKEKNVWSFLDSDPNSLDCIIVMARDVERDLSGNAIKEPSENYYQLENKDFPPFLQLLNESVDSGIQSNKHLQMLSPRSERYYRLRLC